LPVALQAGRCGNDKAATRQNHQRLMQNKNSEADVSDGFVESTVNSCSVLLKGDIQNGVLRLD
jgi:hypothetical protein